MRVKHSLCINSTFLLSFRFPFPESPPCHFLRARSLPGYVSQPLSSVRPEQGPEPWRTSRPKPSRSGLRGQRPQQPPPPLLRGEQCQGQAPAGAQRAAEGRVTQRRVEAAKLEREETHWNWQELEAGEVREGFFHAAQGPIPQWRLRSSRQPPVFLEHNYSKLPRCNPEAQLAMQAPTAPPQRYQRLSKSAESNRAPQTWL